MAKEKMTVEKAVLLKRELEGQVQMMLDDFTRKTGIILKTVKATYNADAVGEMMDGQLTFLEDLPIYSKVDIVGEI